MHCNDCFKPTPSVGRLSGQSRHHQRCRNSLVEVSRVHLKKNIHLTRHEKKIRASIDSQSSESVEVPAINTVGAFSSILVTGSTGGTGQSVVKQLCDMGVEVKALTRDSKKAKNLLPANATIVEADLFDYAETARAVKDCDAIIICSGPTSRMDPFSPFKVDFQGVENIVAAAKVNGVKKIVMVSSIGADDPFFPLNLFGAVLVMKKLGELSLQRSSIDYTIIRPGGLLNQERNAEPSNPVVGAANTFGLPPRRTPGSILRSKVAEACIAALVEPEASNKVIEVISEKGAPSKSWKELFASIS